MSGILSTDHAVFVLCTIQYESYELPDGGACALRWHKVDICHPD